MIASIKYTAMHQLALHSQAILGALLVTFAATPAMANSSANADIAAPLRAVQSNNLANNAVQPSGDQEFSHLFASWRSLEGSGAQGNGFVTPQRDAAQLGAGRFGAVGGIPSIVPVEGYRMTSGFGMRWHPVTGGYKGHKGVDLAAPVGTPVHAPADGIVGRADWFSSYGLFIALEHGSAIETRYGHLSRVTVAAGQMVHKGDVIGYIGTTGRSTGPHLHYEVRVAGEAVNPMPYMQGNGIASPLAAPLAMGGATRFAAATEGDGGDE